MLASAATGSGLEHRESGAEPDRTRDAVEHHVGLHGAHELARRIGPEGDVLHRELGGLGGDRLEEEVFAANPTTSKRWGLAAMTSSA